MDSRLIFESANTYIRNATWTKPKIDAESEWIYIGIDDNMTKVDKVIQEYFITDELYVAVSRDESFQTDKESITNKIKPLIGMADFTIWNWSFQKVIEFNKIGVYRIGMNTSH